MINNKPEEEHKEEDKKEALQKIEELNKQLEVYMKIILHFHDLIILNSIKM